MEVYLFIHTYNQEIGIIIGEICGRLTEKIFRGRRWREKKG
jgi:hypothetical protein